MNLEKVSRIILGEKITCEIKMIVEKHSNKEKELNLKRKLFYQKFVEEGDLCFDVGANVGNRITPLLQIGAKVVAVEPQESCNKVLKWKFGNKIEIVTKGLCEEECVRKFHISNASTISSFSEEWIDLVKSGRFSQYNWNKTVEVEMTTLDNLILKYGLPVFLKIDVEGYELEVLKGLSKSVKMISFEYTVPEQTNKIIDCINTVKSNSDILCNYSIGESMEWAMEKWMTVDEFVKYIKEPEFIKTEFGDVYLKQN